MQAAARSANGHRFCTSFTMNIWRIGLRTGLGGCGSRGRARSRQAAGRQSFKDDPTARENHRPSLRPRHEQADPSDAGGITTVHLATRRDGRGMWPPLSPVWRYHPVRRLPKAITAINTLKQMNERSGGQPHRTSRSAGEELTNSAVEVAGAFDHRPVPAV